MEFTGIEQIVKKNNIQMFDLKFVDLLGQTQHMTVTKNEFTPSLFSDGSGFDGSSIRGFQSINESDMLLVPDISTATIDPFFEIPTLSLTCNIRDPITNENYDKDSRWIAQKAEKYLLSTGIGDISYWGPEVEFFIFDSVRFNQNEHSGYYMIDSEEGIWNSGNKETLYGEPSKGYYPKHKEGYSPAPPIDTLSDLRSEACIELEKFGMKIEKHHHEVATAGQGEISVRYDTLVKAADNVVNYKYVVKNVGYRYGKTVTFMPKPLFGDNGTGMHTHQSIWKKDKNVFYGNGYSGTSDILRYYVGGLIAHSPALLAFCAPTTNSYKRLVPGYEAPVNLVYSARNRSACIRIPMYFDTAEAKRVEYRCPDPSSNPYLAFAAMLMAGLDGIKNKMDPGEPVDKNIYELSDKEASKIKQVPDNLSKSIDALEKDHEFLLQGNVFSKELIKTWIDYKRSREIDPIRLRPHPYEFQLYYDC